VVLLGFIVANAAASAIVASVGAAVQFRELFDSRFDHLVSGWSIVAAITFCVGILYVTVPAVVLIAIAEMNNVFRSLFANALCGGVFGVGCGLIVADDAGSLLSVGPVFIAGLGLGAGVAAGMVYWRIAGCGPERGPIETWVKTNAEPPQPLR